MTGFTVTSLKTGDSLGSATFDGTSWQYTTPKIEKMVQPKLAQGWSPQQILDFYDGWSNGSVKSHNT